MTDKEPILPGSDSTENENTLSADDAREGRESPAFAPDEANPADAQADGGFEPEDDHSKRSKKKKRSAKSRTPNAGDVLGRLLEKEKTIVDLTKEVAEKDKQLKDLNDKWLRSVADFENYRKRSRKEWELLKQQTKAEVILEILNVVDDFERAFAVEGDPDASEFVQGIRLIYNKLLMALDRFGVTEIEASHAPFDPNFHMAVSQIETEDVESGLVAEVVQKGYRLDDSVIRPSKVIVAK